MSPLTAKRQQGRKRSLQRDDRWLGTKETFELEAGATAVMESRFLQPVNSVEGRYNLALPTTVGLSLLETAYLLMPRKKQRVLRTTPDPPMQYSHDRPQANAEQT